MAAFKHLKDACNNFEHRLQQISNELYSARLEETFEDDVAKKTRDISLFSAKSRLLSAKPLSLQPQITSSQKDEDTTLFNYSETVTQKLIERYVVKSATQSHAVKRLLTAPDSTLDPDLLDRKRKILSTLSECSTLESTLMTLDSLKTEKEDTLEEVRARWYQQVGAMRDLRAQATGDDEVNTCGPYYEKLQFYCTKLEQMRWLIAKLTTPRSLGYDWLNDPHNRLQALKLARQPATVDSFVNK